MDLFYHVDLVFFTVAYHSNVCIVFARLLATEEKIFASPKQYDIVQSN